MNFYLVPGDNSEPLTHIAVSPDGSRCLLGTGEGSFFAYGLDGDPPIRLATPRRYAGVAGLAFFDGSAGRGDALGLALTAPATGDIVRVLASGGVELLYADAPHPFRSLALGPDASFGLIAAGDQLLRYYPEQRSYLPVDTPAGIELRSVAIAPGRADGLLAGASAGVGFLARYLPGPDAGTIEPLTAEGLPPLSSVAWNSAGSQALAAGAPGKLVTLSQTGVLTMKPGPAGREVHAVCFHSSDRWALIACGPPESGNRGAALFRHELSSGALSLLYEGPPGAGAFLCAAILPKGDRALIGSEWGQLLEARLDG